MRRKMQAIILGILLSLGLVLTGQIDSYAAETVTIPTDSSVRDCLETSSDANMYKIVISKTGYTTISFTEEEPTADCGWGWDFTLYDANGNTLREYTGMKNGFTTAPLNYKAGTVLFLEVEANYTGSSPAGLYYKIGVTGVANGAWEQENNDTLAAATTLLSNTKRIGTLISSSDADYYAYTVDKKGYFTIDFTRDDPFADAGWGWDIDIYDTAGNLLDSYTGIETNFSTQKFNYKVGTKIYIKITANYSGSAPRDQIYYLQSTATAKSNWEIETRKTTSDSWKSRISGAAKLTGTKRYGSLWTSTDNDVYKLSVSKTGNVTLKFNPNNTEDNVGWGYDIFLYKKNGEKAKVFEYIKTATNQTFYAKKGTYYVVICASYTGSAPSKYDAYSIAATAKASSVPSMASKKVSFTTKKATVKWKKAKKVDGYELQVCKNKKFKKKYTSYFETEKTSYVLPYSVGRGTYYVRVRAYREAITGEKVYGKYTKVKKIKKK